MSKTNVLEKKDKNIFEIIISIILILMIVVLLSLIAIWFVTPKDSGKLLFNIDDKVFATIEVEGKERFVMPNPEAKDGYSFGGWYFDKDTLSDPCTPETIKEKDIKGDTNVYGKWIKNEYTITYNLDGGTNGANPSGYVVDTATIKLAAPTKLGYTFDGWFGQADFKDKAITEIAKGSTGNKELFAKWNKDTYTITYNLNGGAEVTANPTTYAIDTATFTLNAPTKVGYTFGGWYSEDTFATKVTEIAKGSTGNKELFAKWNKDTYTITYNLNGGAEVTANPTTYAIDTETITLNAPTKLGYTFGGWYSEDTFTTQVTEIAIGSTGNKTLFANWTINTYTIKFDTNGGGTITDTTYDILTMPSSFVAPTAKLGYTFAAWYDNATFEGSPITAITLENIGNKTLYAKWTAIEYSITYVLNDGTNSIDNPSKYTIEDAITFANPTKLGYIFEGWYGKADFSDKAITEIAIGSTENKTFYANWEILTYGITYDLNGGSGNHASNPATYTIVDSTIQLQPPTHGKNWMSCDGWYTAATGGEKVTTIATGSTGNLKLYAHWSFTGTPGLMYTLSTDGKSYEVSGSTATGAIGIPSKYNNLPVHIPEQAFFANKKITSVVIDEGVTSIGVQVFRECSALTSVTIPSSVTNIEYAAFAYCWSLTSVTIPSGVRNIGEDAFSDCRALTSIFIPSSVTTIGYRVFDGCTMLTISCECAVAPSTWNELWNGEHNPVPPSRIKWSQTRP